MSYIVSSNVPGFNPVCHFASADPKELIEHFLVRLLVIAQAKN